MTTRNRWWITGTLTTRSNLHLGNGDTVPGDTRVPKERGEHAEVYAIVTDANDKPWIPGSSLRGALREWVSGHDPARATRLFGCGDRNNERAGSVTVYGAGYAKHDFTPALFGDTEHFDKDRITLIEAGVAIDRNLGTASDEKLYHMEVVPAGVTFDVAIEARDVDEVDIAWLQGAFEAFNADQLSLGGETHSGKGRLHWRSNAVKCLEGADLAHWAHDALLGSLDTPQARSKPRDIQAITQPENLPALDITLRFDGLFCVNDPGRAAWVTSEKKRRKVNGGNVNDEHLADKLPRLDADGRAYLPAKSFRGVLRRQIERIARTIGLQACGEGTGCNCKAVHRLNQVKRLSYRFCSVCQLMGAPGWKSLLHIDDFRQQGEAQPLTQEFLAIDRFTGGGADGKKFNARAVVRPTLQGRIRLDEDRLRHIEAPDALLALLALALRDLKEGDLRFGLGVAKGYGTCKANIVAHPGAGTDDNWTRIVDWLDNWPMKWTLAAPIQPAPSGAPAHPIVEPSATPNKPAAGEFHNPYHFIPTPVPDLSTWTERSAFPGVAGHERYLGQVEYKPVYSGRILCRLTAETPFFVGARREREASETLPARVDGFDLDGKPALPASSLRGMIAALVEAATGSSLRVLDDHVLSYRKPAEARSLSRLGRIVRVEENGKRYLRLQPLRYEKHVMDDATRAQLIAQGGELREMHAASRAMPRNRRNEIYIPPGAEEGKPLPIHQFAKDRLHALADERTAYSMRKNSQAPDEVLLPYAPLGTARNSNPAEDERNLRIKPGDLVWFETSPDGKVVTELSYSAIWRGRAEYDEEENGKKVLKPATVHRFFAKLSEELLPFNAKRQFVSPAEAMFGFTSGDRKGKADDATDWLAYRGRVFPGFGLPVKNAVRLPEVTLKILDSPKPPSPNLYFRTGAQPIRKSELNPKDHPPQGRKHYLHHHVEGSAQPWKTAKSPGQRGESFKQHVAIRPVKAGAEFLFHLDFENLSEWELSALCFALRPGDHFRHKLGMGKPLGLGTVCIDPEGLFLIDRPRRYLEGGERYHHVWLALADKRDDWKTWYPDEAKLQETPGAPKWNDLRDSFRAGMNPDVLRALDFLGDPAYVTAPVHYPLESGAPDPEGEHFKWFMNNERWVEKDRHETNPANKGAQALAALNASSSELPTLKANTHPPRNQPAPGRSIGGGGHRRGRN